MGPAFLLDSKRRRTSVQTVGASADLHAHNIVGGALNATIAGAVTTMSETAVVGPQCHDSSLAFARNRDTLDADSGAPDAPQSVLQCLARTASCGSQERLPQWQVSHEEARGRTGESDRIPSAPALQRDVGSYPLLLGTGYSDGGHSMASTAPQTLQPQASETATSTSCIHSAPSTPHRLTPFVHSPGAGLPSFCIDELL
jgi:hypothetical protein